MQETIEDVQGVLLAERWDHWQIRTELSWPIRTKYAGCIATNFVSAAEKRQLIAWSLTRNWSLPQEDPFTGVWCPEHFSRSSFHLIPMMIKMWSLALIKRSQLTVLNVLTWLCFVISERRKRTRIEKKCENQCQGETVKRLSFLKIISIRRRTLERKF